MRRFPTAVEIAIRSPCHCVFLLSFWRPRIRNVSRGRLSRSEVRKKAALLFRLLVFTILFLRGKKKQFLKLTTLCILFLNKCRLLKCTVCERGVCCADGQAVIFHLCRSHVAGWFDGRLQRKIIKVTTQDDFIAARKITVPYYLFA